MRVQTAYPRCHRGNMQDTPLFTRLQCILSSKDLENLEKSLFARDRAENQYWMHIENRRKHHPLLLAETHLK